MKDVAGERPEGSSSAGRVDDIKAVLSRYGIHRFRYHTWDGGGDGRPAGAGRQEVPRGGYLAVDYFQGGGDGAAFRDADTRMDPTNSASGVAESSSRGVPANLGGGVASSTGALDPGWGAGGVPWEPPEDLAGTRLPIFADMAVPPGVVASLVSPRGVAPIVSEVDEGEQVPDAPPAQQTSRTLERPHVVPERGREDVGPGALAARDDAWRRRHRKASTRDSALHYFLMGRQHE